MVHDILLHTQHVRREQFDPTNEEHIASFKVFIRTGNWGAVQFYAEQPFTEVPMTVLMRFCQHSLSTIREDPTETRQRLEAKTLIPMPTSMSNDQRAAALARSNELLLSTIGRR